MENDEGDRYNSLIAAHVTALIEAHKRLTGAISAYDPELVSSCREEVRIIREHMDALRGEHLKALASRTKC